MTIPVNELIDFLAMHPGGFTTESGLKIGRSKWGIFTHADFPSEIFDFIAEEGFFKMSIHTEADSEWSFMEGFKLDSISQIPLLSHQHSWMRYLNGQAEITIDLISYEFELTFFIRNYKTIVYSPSLHFYDEVPDHLTTEEDFERYLTRHQDFLLDQYHRYT
jgi:hypothetical protein